MLISILKRAVWPTVLLCLTFLGGCITPDNAVLEGLGTPDITGCSSIPGVENGADYRPRTAIKLGTDNRTHPDVFYMGWAQLDERSDLRFPQKGYDGNGFEDKLLVTRKTASPANEDDPTAGNVVRTWQLLPQVDNNCNDVEKIRIHSFDVAPNGRSLYVSMARTGAGDTHLGVYRLDLETGDLAKISQEDDIHFMYPTYVGNDPDTKHEMLVVAKTVTAADIPHNYAQRIQLVDEYDRAPTPLIHTMDSQTGETVRIGLNNSHQTEPFVMVGPDGNRIVIFTQWEHQDSVNRFALWKTQIDGSDNFTFFGQESSEDKSGAHLFQARPIKSGPYQGYVIMTESHNKFDAEGHIAFTFRHHQELRSAKHYLQRVEQAGSTNTQISRNPEHYNDESFVYSSRADSNYTYQLYIKDFPAVPSATPTAGVGEQLTPDTDNYHFVQARSYYPPERELIAPTNAADLGENRVSFTNENLNGRAGFLVQNLAQSDNGVQHQLDGLAPEDISMQFFLPSHHFSNSKTIGVKSSPEMSIPASGFISPESDGSMGVVMKEGLYVWKVNKRFKHAEQDIWLPVRSERQEVTFVPNRVNACNQCHQERDQTNLDLYANYDSIAARKMHGDLSDVVDISHYSAYNAVPDFHQDIMPLLTKPALGGGQSCAQCHTAGTKLDLSNTTGTEAMNSTYRTLIRGAKLLDSGNLLPYSNDSINPLGMDDNYHPAPLLWSLLLGDDLSVPPDADYANDSNRNLDRPGDYGATYDAEVETTINTINAQYDHSKHLSAADIQKFITYSSTQMPAGLSDRMTFVPQSGNYRSGNAGQKAYQAMVRNCFSCHNSFTTATGGGIEDPLYGLPLEKRFSSSTGMRDKRMRFMVRNHIANKHDTKYSKYNWQSNINTARDQTLLSASYRINFADIDNSEILRYALGTDANGTPLNQAQHGVQHPQVLNEQHADYLAIKHWASAQSDTPNQAPTLDASIPAFTIKEYDPPAYLPAQITWTDPDLGPNGLQELSQAFIAGNSTSSHNFNDSMLALEYDSFTAARIETYAILGDRGNQNFSFYVTDGADGSVQNVPVTITTDYTVPAPTATLPNAYAFYTVRNLGGNADAGQLRRLAHDAANPSVPKDTLIGTIPGYTNEWTTVYRRADKGWLYFIEQSTQMIHVVDETTAAVQFHIKLNHEPNKRGDKHKQTNYLLWWRAKEGLDHLSNTDCTEGELQGLLESKLSDESARNGDWYIGLGCGELPAGGVGSTIEVTPEYRTKLADGGNTLAVYTWKRATFMSKWVNEGVDRLNVLNLVTGKAKSLGDFDFPAQALSTDPATRYPAATYANVRAVVVAEDGAFYGFNKDTNDQPVTLFNFDPLEEVQQPVNTPEWINTYFTQYQSYGTPFLVIEPRAVQP